MEMERENRRDRRVPGPRPASLPVTRRESRRPARKRPVGISIFLRPFPLPRRAAPRNTAPSRRLVDQRAVRFFRAVPRDRARAPERTRSNDRESFVQTGFELATLLHRNNDEFRTRKNAFPSSSPEGIPKIINYRNALRIYETILFTTFDDVKIVDRLSTVAI